MANLTGYLGAPHGDTSVVDSSQQVPLGTRARDTSGNEYIYLQGVGSTVATDFVVFDENYATTRAIANEVGPVAVAMAAVDATTEYGWYQIYGKATANVLTAAAADKALYLTATAGRLDDDDVAQDSVHGAFNMAEAAANSSTVWINYPFVTDIAHD